MTYQVTLPPNNRADGVDVVDDDDHNFLVNAISGMYTELGTDLKGSYADLKARLTQIDTDIVHPSRYLEWTSQGTFGLITDVNAWYPMESVTLKSWQIAAPSSGFPTSGTVVVKLRKNGIDIGTITWDLSAGKYATGSLTATMVAGDELVPYVQSVGGLGAGESLKNVVIHVEYEAS